MTGIVGNIISVLKTLVDRKEDSHQIGYPFGVSLLSISNQSWVTD